VVAVSLADSASDAINGAMQESPQVVQVKRH
jgi:hypothetical protein